MRTISALLRQGSFLGSFLTRSVLLLGSASYIHVWNRFLVQTLYTHLCGCGPYMIEVILACRFAQALIHPIDTVKTRLQVCMRQSYAAA